MSTSPSPRPDDPPPEKLRFFLGGRDLEMCAIAELVRATLGPAAVVDRSLSWGARACAYATEIAAAIAQRLVPVLVELENDLPVRGRTIVVDHHGPAAGGPSALAQCFALLRLPAGRWTRRLALIDANDVGHVAAMRRLGATAEEMTAVRAEDRRAQGITPAQEAEGLAALGAGRPALDGRLLVVDLPHPHTATVTDPIALDPRWAGPDNLLVLMPDEIAFFGDGAAVGALDAACPGGWSGGELPERGFWGHLGRKGALETDLLDVLAASLGADRARDGNRCIFH